MKINFYTGRAEAFRGLADAVSEDIRRGAAKGSAYFLALSGGDSAKSLFNALAESGLETGRWSTARIFWVDERCVPTESSESNFGEADRLFLSGRIPPENVFRIRGEAFSPEREAERYSALVREMLPSENGFPRFDCVVLGVGSDGHTASIFPDYAGLLCSSSPYAVSDNPNDGTVRVTMTGGTILNARRIFCPITVKGKRPSFLSMLSELESGRYSTPAAYIFSRAGNAEIFTDIDFVKR